MLLADEARVSVFITEPSREIVILEIPRIDFEVELNVPRDVFERAVAALELASTLVSVHGTVAGVRLEAARDGLSVMVNLGLSPTQASPSPPGPRLPPCRPPSLRTQALRFVRETRVEVFSMFLKEFTRGPAELLTLRIADDVPLCVDYALREGSFLRFYAAPQSPDHDDVSEEDLVMD